MVCCIRQERENITKLTFTIFSFLFFFFFLLFHSIFIFVFVGDGSSIFLPSWNSDRSFLSVLASLEVDTAAMD